MSMKLSPENEEMIERLVTERIESILSPTGISHPDMMWTTRLPYQKGALTQKQISDFVQHLLTGRIPETLTGQ
jgi:hypothetical protein